MDGLVPFIIMIGTVFCCDRCKIVYDWSRALGSWLGFEGIEDLVNKEPKRSEVLCRLESSERVQ